MKTGKPVRDALMAALKQRAANLTIKSPRTWGTGLNVHTLEPMKLRDLQIATDATSKRIHKKRALNRRTATRYLNEKHEDIRRAESVEKRR